MELPTFVMNFENEFCFWKQSCQNLHLQEKRCLYTESPTKVLYKKRYIIAVLGGFPSSSELDHLLECGPLFFASWAFASIMVLELLDCTCEAPSFVCYVCHMMHDFCFFFLFFFYVYANEVKCMTCMGMI